MKSLNVAVIGHEGRMGAMFAERLAECGHRVRGLDRPLSAEKAAEALGNVDLALLCVPAAAFAEVLKIITPYLPSDALLMDIASVKSLPMADMRAAWKGRMVGSHPLFGPNPPPDPRVALMRECDTCPACFELARELFEDMGYVVFETTAKKHDQAMAAVQGLNFISNLAYLAALAHQDELLPFLTPSFRRRLESARKMLTEDGELFSGLFEANPYAQDAVKHFRSYLHVAAGGDVDLLLEKTKWWWGKGE